MEAGNGTSLRKVVVFLHCWRFIRAIPGAGVRDNAVYSFHILAPVVLHFQIVFKNISLLSRVCFAISEALSRFHLTIKNLFRKSADSTMS